MSRRRCGRPPAPALTSPALSTTVPHRHRHTLALPKEDAATLYLLFSVHAAPC